MRLGALGLGALVLACGAGTHPFVPRDAGGDGAAADGGRDGGPVCPPVECEPVDADRDGEPAPPCGHDCDDTAAAVRPGALDAFGDGVDQDCDGADGVDQDGDGHQAVSAGGDDCDDTRATVRPGANDGQGWIVEDTPMFGIGLELELDAWGKPVVAYGSERADRCFTAAEDQPENFFYPSQVSVARWLAGEWVTEVIDDGCVWTRLGLALTPSGQPVVAYSLRSLLDDFEVRVATLRHDGWAVQSLDTDARSAVGAAPGTCGDVLVAYSKGPYLGAGAEGVLRLTRGLEGWDVGTIGLGGGWGQTSVTAVDDRAIFVAFVRPLPAPEWGSSEIMLAADDGGGWQAGSVAVVTDFVFDLRMALDPSREAHIVWSAENGLSLASPDASVTVIDPRRQPPAPADDHGVSRCTVSLEIDGDGVSHVAYLGRLSVEDDDYPADHIYSVYHIYYANDRAGVWTITPVGALLESSAVAFGAELNGWPSLALDRDGGVSILYSAFAEVGQLIRYPNVVHATLGRPNDGIDQNCDGVDGVDADGDGHASTETGGDDPDDGDPGR